MSYGKEKVYILKERKFIDLNQNLNDYKSMVKELNVAKKRSDKTLEGCFEEINSLKEIMTKLENENELLKINQSECVWF